MSPRWESHTAWRAQVGECVGAYWRPGFDFNLYPYCPAHISKPKEVKKLYLVPLPEKCFFAVRTTPTSIPLQHCQFDTGIIGGIPTLSALIHVVLSVLVRKLSHLSMRQYCEPWLLE